MELDDLPLPPPPFPVQQASPGKHGGGEGPAPADTHTTSAANGTHHAHKAGERRHRGNRGGQDAGPQGDEQTGSPAPRPSKVSKTNLVPVTGSRLGSITEAPQASEAPTPAASAEPKAIAASLAPSTGSVDVQRAVQAAVEAAAAADAAAVAARAVAEPGQQGAVDGMQAEQLQMLENYAKDVAIQAAGLQVSFPAEPCGNGCRWTPPVFVGLLRCCASTGAQGRASHMQGTRCWFPFRRGMQLTHRTWHVGLCKPGWQQAGPCLLCAMAKDCPSLPDLMPSTQGRT